MWQSNPCVSVHVQVFSPSGSWHCLKHLLCRSPKANVHVSQSLICNVAMNMNSLITCYNFPARIQVFHSLWTCWDLRENLKTPIFFYLPKTLNTHLNVQFHRLTWFVTASLQTTSSCYQNPRWLSRYAVGVHNCSHQAPQDFGEWTR